MQEQYPVPQFCGRCSGCASTCRLRHPVICQPLQANNKPMPPNTHIAATMTTMNLIVSSILYRMDGTHVYPPDQVAFFTYFTLFSPVK
jgi:hypothetical protein